MVRFESLLIAGALVAVLAPLGCDTNPGADPTSPLTRDVLAQVARVVEPAVADFRAAAVDLETAAAAWDGGDDAAVQAAWRAAFLAWQPLELMQVGPLGSSLDVVGGADLRDAAYSWPAINRCEVDRVTANGGWDAADFFTTSLVVVQGLDALETLIFSPAGVTTCFPTVDIVREGTWEALGVDGVQQRRAAYAAALAARLVEVADAIDAAWRPDGGDWGGALASAGEAGSPYADGADALDAVFHALFYVETEVKDRKLGKVLGLAYCEAASCPEDVEATFADASAAAIVANLDGFDALFHGGDGPGFDDLLVEAGHDDLLAAIDAAIAAARDAAAAVEVPLEDGATDAKVRAAYDAVKALTDLVKGDLATVLTLRIPAEASGDND